jgi:hypothetical protein
MQGTSRGTGRPAGHAKSRAASSSKGVSKSAASAKKAKVTPKAAREVVLARVEAVRLAQRQEGNFDCFATARDGYCDQGGCLYHSECLDFSQRMR